MKFHWIDKRLPGKIVALPMLVLFLLTTYPYSEGNTWVWDDPFEDGVRVYQDKCAHCHGDDGQGVAGVYDLALYGSRSVAELTRLIERTMPEGEADTCVAEEAAAVARYIHHEFYSPAARVRKGLDPPMQVELSRLTVSQYRNAVADVIAHFTPTPQETKRLLGDRRRNRGGRAAAEAAADAGSFEAGLKGSYFASKGMSKADQLAQTRIDHRIDFDFGSSAPFADMPEDQFAIVWEGSIWIHETGDYHLRVATPNGARVYLNLDPSPGLHKLRDDSAAAGQFPLIDAWVGSGELREETARVFLLGGRRYPLRVEFFKYQEATASLRLEWKPPHGVWSVLDGTHLTTAEACRTFVVDTVFPADDRSLGFERGNSVSALWYTAVTEAAVKAADEVVNRLPLLAGVPAVPAPSEATDAENDPNANEAAQVARLRQLQDFVVRFASVAFRRPLTGQEAERLGQILFADSTVPEVAVRRAIVWILSSPEFLYTDLTPHHAPPAPEVVAKRLALALWDSVPDPHLMASAAAGQLTSHQEVEEQARRMLEDSRTRHKLAGFFHHWLHLEDRDLMKDSELFPEFDEAVIADLRRSLDMFLDQVVWSEESDYRQLLLDDEVWLNPRLRQAYAGESTDNISEEAGQGDFQAVVLDQGKRAGVLTHPYLLSALAYHNNTSPIHRGVFVTRNVLGRSLRAPPVAIAFENDEFPADLTMRQKVAHLTQDASCLSCHTIINPLGFSLEHFDAIGRWRESESGREIDASSDYETEEGEVIQLSGARDVAQMAVSSEAAHRAFVLQLFQHMTKQVPAAYGPEVLPDLVTQFAEDQFHIQNLMVRIAVLVARHGSDIASQEVTKQEVQN